MPDNNKKAASYIGLACKAGRLVSGEYMVEKTIKEGNASLVIVAGDASENTKKNFRDACAYRNVPYLEFSTKEEIGRMTGKDIRACIALTDPGFASAIDKCLNVPVQNGGVHIEENN